MKQFDFNTVRTLTQQVKFFWRSRILYRWQTAYLPRLVWPDQQIPRFVQECPVTQLLIQQFRLLDWERLPLPATTHWFGQAPTPLAAYIGAFLEAVRKLLPLRKTIL